MSKKQVFSFRVLTPTHIGSGEELTPGDYLYDDGDCVVINVPGLLNSADFQPYFQKYLKNAAIQRPIVESVPEKEILLKHSLYRTAVYGSVRDKLASHSINIKGCVKTAGRPIVPGSSVKGSILSALIWHVIKENYSKDRSLQTRLSQTLRTASSGGRRFRGGYDDGRDQMDFSGLLNYVIPKLGRQGNNRFDKWLTLSDSEPLEPERCLTICCAEVLGARTQGKLPILYEALRQDTVFHIEVDTANCRFDADDILQIMDEFYDRVYTLDYEYSDWEAPDGIYIFRLGQGASAFATSLLIAAQDLNIPYGIKPPRTRKRVDNLPMGWMEVELNG